MHTLTVTNVDQRTFGININAATVDVYDLSYPDKFGPIGQYIASYRLPTFMTLTAGLDMDWGIPVWRLDADNVADIKRHITGES